MNQTTLHLPPARARNTDPDTSHIAARKITRKGLQGQQADVLCLLKLHPHCTAAELAEAPGSKADCYQFNRRLPELVKAGLARRGNARKCRIRGSLCTTWEAV